MHFTFRQKKSDLNAAGQVSDLLRDSRRGVVKQEKGKGKMTQFFMKRLRMLSGPPVLASVRKVPVFGEHNIVTVDLDSPVSVPVTRMKEIEYLVEFILRQIASEIGVRDFRDEKVDFILSSHVGRVKSFNAQVERHTILVQLVDTPAEEGESPVRNLVLVHIDLKYPRLVHVRRILRKLRVRWVMAKDAIDGRDFVSVKSVDEGKNSDA